ncbi:MAG: hypothetical protein FWD47_11125 [Treponema sp.]|nr:hypothetical protein [Treponema sp.]
MKKMIKVFGIVLILMVMVVGVVFASQFFRDGYWTSNDNDYHINIRHLGQDYYLIEYYHIEWGRIISCRDGRLSSNGYQINFTDNAGNPHQLRQRNDNRFNCTVTGGVFRWNRDR